MHAALVSFFPLSRTRTSSRGKARAAGEPSASRRRYGAIELRSRRAIRHGSAHPLRCDGRSAAPSSEKPYLFWQHVSTLTGCPQHPSDLPRTSHITSRPFPVRAVHRRLAGVLCAPDPIVNIQSWPLHSALFRSQTALPGGMRELFVGIREHF